MTQRAHIVLFRHASLEVRITRESGQCRGLLVDLATGKTLLDAEYVSREVDPDEARYDIYQLVMTHFVDLFHEARGRGLTALH